jgi:hypothetical protein
VLIIILLIYKMKFFAAAGISRIALIGIFMLKIAAGFILWRIYAIHYSGGDQQAYFNDGNVLFKLLHTDPKHFFDVVFNNDPNTELQTWRSSFENIMYNDSRTMVLLNTLFRIFSFGYFAVHIVFINFLSFIGLTALYKTCSGYFFDRKKLLIAAVFLLPSVLFWGSGVLKESLLIFGTGMLIYYTEAGFLRSFSFRKGLLIFCSILLLLAVKFYVLLALIPGLFVNAWISRSSARFIFWRYLSIFTLGAFAAVLLSTVNPAYNVLKIIANKQQKSWGVAEGGVFLLSSTHFARINYFQKDSILIPAGNNNYKIKLNSSYEAWDLKHITDTLFIAHAADTSTYHIVYQVVPPSRSIAALHLKPSVFSFIKNAPRAFWNTLTVPFIFKVNGWLEFFAGIENLIYCSCIVLLFFCFKNPGEKLPMVYFCCTFVLMIFILAGLTTPITGALIRYKTPALPFLMMAVFLLLDKNKLQKLPLIRKIVN